MDSSKSPFDDPDLRRNSESATADASSATGIFGTVSGKPQPQEDDFLKSLFGNLGGSTTPPADAPRTPAAPPASTPSSTPAASPGGFTDMFQALQGSGSAASAPAAPPAPASTPPNSSPSSPTDLSSVFTQVVVEKSTFPPPSPAPVPKPGEFTQLLQTLTASAQNPERPVAPPPATTPIAATPVAAPPASAPPAPAAGPGSGPVSGPGAFTQLFSSVSPPASSTLGAGLEPTAQIPIYSPPSPAPQPQTKPEPSVRGQTGPGDFTRMFQSVTSPDEAPPKPSPGTPAFSTSQWATPQPPASSPSSGPGAFTQMFAPKPLETTPAEDPLKSLRPEPVSAPMHAPSSGTFSFQTPPPRPLEPAPVAQGGFTQLLHALNKEEPAAQHPEPFMPPSPPAPAAPASGMGGFTQLLRTLSAEPASPPVVQPAPMPPIQPAPAPPPVSGAPGEFTRVISSSQMREMQGQSITPGPPVLPPQSAASRPPLQFPSAPAFPAAPPMPQMQTPQMPVAHPPAAAPVPAMPHFQPPAFQFPPAPAPPAPPPPAPSKLQQYLPLILVLNIFVLLVIVVILVFVLRHH